MENLKKDLAITLQKCSDGWAVSFRAREVGTNGGKRKTTSERCGQTFASVASAISAVGTMMADFAEKQDEDNLVGTLFENVPDETQETTPAQDKRKARGKRDKGNGHYPAESSRSVFVPKGKAGRVAKSNEEAKGVFVDQAKEEQAR